MTIYRVSVAILAALLFFLLGVHMGLEMAAEIAKEREGNKCVLKTTSATHRTSPIF